MNCAPFRAGTAWLDTGNHFWLHKLEVYTRGLANRVAKPPFRGENRVVPDPRYSPGKNPFPPGSIVIVTLANPREKLWGAVVALLPEGLSLCGVELASFDDLLSMVKEGESVSPGVIFFPMHRIERIELDLPDGNLPSLSQRFTSKTGLDPVSVLTRSLSAQASPEAQP